MNGPLGPNRGDYHAAEIALVIANANRGKRSKKFKFTDFLLKWGDEKRSGRAGGDENVETGDQG